MPAYTPPKGFTPKPVTTTAGTPLPGYGSSGSTSWGSLGPAPGSNPWGTTGSNPVATTPSGSTVPAPPVPTPTPGGTVTGKSNPGGVTTGAGPAGSTAVSTVPSTSTTASDIQALWKSIGDSFNTGLQAQFSDIDAQTSLNARRANEANAVSGGAALGGAAMAGQAQAQLGGIQMRQEAIAGSEKNKLGAKMAMLQMKMDQAKQERDIQAQKDIQQLMDETSVAIAKASAGITTDGSTSTSPTPIAGGGYQVGDTTITSPALNYFSDTFSQAGNVSIPANNAHVVQDWASKQPNFAELVNMTPDELKQFMSSHPSVMADFLSYYRAQTGSNPDPRG